jgi:thiosulfate/3-mercaptopyruvate sulfurtransferase
MDSLVSTQWLASETGASDLRILDASAHLPATGRNAEAEYEAAHIPGAIFMDLAGIIDPVSPTENCVPDAARFAAMMQDLGLGDGSRILVYDDSDIHSAARAWFLLRMFGAQNVAILDGGLAKWKAEGRPLAQGRETRPPRHFTPWTEPARLRTKEDIASNLASRTEQVVDARSAARFSGAEGDPRPHIASGHIPGSLNVPYAGLFEPDGTFMDKAGLRAAFERAGVDLARPVVTSCGSGMTACVLAFALHLLGKNDVALYDGSWSDWGSDPATPKSVGEQVA